MPGLHLKQELELPSTIAPIVNLSFNYLHNASRESEHYVESRCRVQVNEQYTGQVAKLPFQN